MIELEVTMPPISPAILLQAVTDIRTTARPVATGADVENWCTRKKPRVVVHSGGKRHNDLFEAADHSQATANVLQKYKRGRARNGTVAWSLVGESQAARRWLRGQPGGWLVLHWDAARGRWDWQSGTPV